MAEPSRDPQIVVLVTGPSGAGRSTAIAALEDLSFEVIDNLPLNLVPRVTSGAAQARPLALGIDARNRDFSAQSFLELITSLRKTEEIVATVLYVDCSEAQLLNRFSETRRRHPVAPSQAPEVGIKQELALLDPIRHGADVIIDTTDMTIHDLRAEVSRWFAPNDSSPLSISVQSFSYKRGLPPGLDMVFDVRFLRNPHWDKTLAPRTGQDPDVKAYIAADPLYAAFCDKVQDLLVMLLPAYTTEGKSHFSIGFGCTGGQHRSVALAETTAAALAQAQWRVSLRHRELDRRPDLSQTGKG